MRVLKPGGHLLAFAAPRTQDLMAMSVRLAGFEIRDGLAWIFGQGYPKSLDVSKAIDKRAEENIETKRRIAAVAEVIRSHREAKGMTPQQVSLAVVGTPSGACWNWEHQQLPSVEMWPAIKAALGIPARYDALIEGDRARFIAAEREAVARGYRIRRESTVQIVGLSDGAYDITAAATEDAARWDGWGTALKPAHEPIIFARKPLAGTVARNVVEYGTGAVNIAACRVGSEARVNNAGGVSSLQRVSRVEQGYRPTVTASSNEDSEVAGRWPPNVMLSRRGRRGDGPAERSAHLARKPLPHHADHGKFRGTLGDIRRAAGRESYRAHSGGASRFFPVFRYEAKAPASERPRLADGTAHNTVKPLDLMRWLVRLVTPPGGTVLDPFAGSGTTGEACVIEGFNCILTEKDPSSAELIKARLSKPIQPVLFGEEAS